MMATAYTGSSAAQTTRYSQCQNGNYVPERIPQLHQQRRSFLREQLANRQLSSLLRMTNHQSRCQPQARRQRNWRNSLPVNPARLQAASRSSLECSHSNSNLDHFLMNLTDQIITRKPIQMTKMRSAMKSKKFWKSPRNKSKVSLKSLLVILAVLIHLAVLMNLIINLAKSILNVTAAVMRWILTLILTMTFH